jgi:hypothetical protein
MVRAGFDEVSFCGEARVWLSLFPFSGRRRSPSLLLKIARTASAVSAQVFPFPCRFPLRWRRGEASIPDQALIVQASPNDGAEHRDEPARIIVRALIKPERLFIEVTKEVERLDADVSAFDPALQRAPEVFHAVSVDAAINVRLGVVDDAMGIGVGQPV